MKPAAEGPFRAGAWRVEPARHALISDHAERQLEPRVMTLLVYLATHAGDVVSTEQLLADIWGGTFYGDSPVQRAIALLRKALGDDAQAPTYIETIRKRGYRFVASVSPLDGIADPAHAGDWKAGNPFPGLAPYDADRAAVFFGRQRATRRVVDAIDAQCSAGSSFVLLAGASGSGKTSLMQAGVLPSLWRRADADTRPLAGMACVDLRTIAHQRGLDRFAEALHTWQIRGRRVFSDRDRLLDAILDDDDHWLEDALDEAARRHLAASRGVDTLPMLLAMVDHGEAITHDLDWTARDLRSLEALLRRLAGHALTMVVLTCRSDAYPALLDRMPSVAGLKHPSGHVDLMPPAPGELADMIRGPARAAGLVFARDPITGTGLDDELRDAAIARPDCLPMLQFVLRCLHDAQDPPGTLSLEAYRRLGGIGGALATRAEDGLARLPTETRATLPDLFSRLVRRRRADTRLIARRVPWRELDTPTERELARHLVAARLLVSTLDAAEPHLEIAHEALLREWPRVRAWADENARLLSTHARLAAATQRWLEGDRSDDLLLHHGHPLGEALELRATVRSWLDADERDLVARSSHAAMRRRRRRMAGVILVVALGVVSTLAGALAHRSEQDARRRQVQAESLAGYLVMELADDLRPLGRLGLLEGVARRTDEHLRGLPPRDTTDEARLQRVRALRLLGEVAMERADDDAARTAFTTAGDVLAEVGPHARGTDAWWEEHATLEYWSGVLAYQQDDLDTADAAFRRYLDVATGLALSSGAGERWTLERSYALNSLGTLAMARRDPARALERFGESIAIKRAIDRSPATDATLDAELADSLSWLASAQDASGLLLDASSSVREQHDLLARLVADFPGDAQWRHRLALSQLAHADLALASGSPDAARESCRLAMLALETLLELDGTNHGWHRDSVHGLVMCSRVADAVGDRAGSIALADRARGRWPTDGHATREDRRLDALLDLRLAEAHEAARDRPHAEAFASDARRKIDDLHASDIDDLSTLIIRSGVDIFIGDLQSDHALATAAWKRAHDTLAAHAAGSRDRRILVPWVKATCRLHGCARAATQIERLSAMGYRGPDPHPANTSPEGTAP